MANYDSDSSAGEEEEFTETNVLLGYASKDPGDDSISRLGGRPEWIDAETPPSAALAKCHICKDLMVLLLQLNAELPDRFPGHERRLYVFACQKKSCRRREGSIRALRSLRAAPGSKVAPLNSDKKKKEDKPKPKEEPKPPTNLGETLFGAKTLGRASGANPFATSSSATSNPFASSSNPFSTPQPAAESTKDPNPEPAPETETNKEVEALPKTFAETLSLNNPQANTPQPPAEPWPPEASQPKPYPISYLSEAEYETLDPTPPPVPQATIKMDVDDNSGSGGGKEDKEVFESTMDAAFQRFADRLAQNPEQSIRYEFAGIPLLYSKTDAVGKALAPSQPDGVGVTVASGGGVKGIPRCPNCGGPRTFEVQLCPHAITELEAEELSLEGMDWGTIIVGVCERDCQARGVDEGQVGYLEEWAGVQWEEIGSSAPGGGRR
ncbi:programmed cell death protein 2 [Xylaria arbuscula]|nr:programmed cell death protein 2 [Xylaria arbuscula]